MARRSAAKPAAQEVAETFADAGAVLSEAIQTVAEYAAGVAKVAGLTSELRLGLIASRAELRKLTRALEEMKAETAAFRREMGRQPRRGPDLGDRTATATPDPALGSGASE
jgi:hypothetical protein